MGRNHVNQDKLCGQHAVVIGASVAGLLAARVLSEHFERVTIIERDQLLNDGRPRKGVPQGQHIHLLASKGVEILSEFFPDLFPELVRAGATEMDVAADLHWFHFGCWLLQCPSQVCVYSQSRPLLEWQIRRRVAARTNVRFIDRCRVINLSADAEGACITGVHVQRCDEAQQHIPAELVVDASGRGSQVPNWLMALGYPCVEESIVRVDLGYATRIFRRPPTTVVRTGATRDDWKALGIYPLPPEGRRAGYVFPIEDNAWIVTLSGWHRDYPPTDEEGFFAYARSLAQPDIYEAIRDAIPLTPVVSYRFPANRRRHYERLVRFPDGLVVLGDAACSFNPVYGQGMTVALLEATELQRCLLRHRCTHPYGNLTGLASHCCKAFARVIDIPWWLATGEDFRYPETQGRRPFGLGFLHWYTRRVALLAARQPFVTRRFYEVLNQLQSPVALFHPGILFAMLCKSGMGGVSRVIAGGGQASLARRQSEEESNQAGIL